MPLRLLAVLAFALALPAAAAPLVFDTTFGTGGKVSTRLSRTPSDEEARAVAFQPDGKTVIAGICGGPPFPGVNEICVARFTNAGALDATFGELGTFRVAAPVGDASIRAVTLDGTKIVVAGSCGNAGAQDFCVLRLNANGTLDTTFNTTGIAVTPIGTLDDRAYAVAMDGTKIVVAGECEVSGSTDMCLARYNTDGSLDAAFGTGGKRIHALSASFDAAYALAVISGQVYAGGSCGPSPSSFCVVRLTATGALDATWGNGGMLYNWVGSSYSKVTALAASGSRLLAGGECINGGTTDFCLLRIDSTGLPDTTLNGDGIVLRPMGTGEDRLTGLTLVGGRTYLSGNCDSGGKKVFCMVELTETGGINGVFNGGSVLLDPIGSTDAVAIGLAPGFSVLTMAGTCGAFLTYRDWCITRYTLSGERDTSLNTTGLVVKDLRLDPGADIPTALLRQPDGKLLAAGWCSVDGAVTSTRCLVRYSGNGVLDASFGTGGILEVNLGGYVGAATLALDGVGRIYVAGYCPNVNFFCVTRLLASGAIDATYGTGGTASVSAGAGVTVEGVSGVVVDAAGAAAVGGSCKLMPVFIDFCVVKFDASGAVDSSFGSGGKVIVSLDTNDSPASFIGDGTGFVFSGSCFSGSGGRYCVVRLLANGSLDPAFGSGSGRVSFEISTGQAGAAVAAISATGHIWLAGTCSVAGVNQFCIARLLADGSLDLGFSGDGKAYAPVNGVSDSALALLPDGTGLLVAGTCTQSGPPGVNDFCLARFLADGTLDPAFNDGGTYTTHFGRAFDFNYGWALLREGNRVVALVDAYGFNLAAFSLLANDVPRAPTSVVATAGDGQVSVAFVPPTDDGGNTITSYGATCGGQANTGAASPIVVSGLANGVAVTCTVTATNSAGTGPASPASASVTPRKPTSVVVSSSVSPALVGATVILTATVTGESPQGSVIFKDGGATILAGLCSGASVSAGEAACSVNNLAAGTHNITAEYSGDIANGPSTSPVFAQSIIASGFTLTVAIATSPPGAGNGRVTSSPAGIDCGSTTSSCQASFAGGTVVTITATPDAGHLFAYWTGACSGSGACVVTMNANRTFGATFAPGAPVPRTLTITRNGTGAGTVTSTPAGIACGATCTADFPDGSSVPLTATPNAGSTFAGWTGGGCSGTGACNVTMDAAKAVIATFTQVTYTVTPSAGANGSISPNTAQTVAQGATRAFTVTPNAGFTAVVGGTCGGALVGTTYTTNAITASCTVAATFTQVTRTVTPSAGANGSISPNTAQTVAQGATKAFTVTANAGYTAVVGGTCGGALVGTTYTTNAITANCTVAATFTQITRTVTSSAGANGTISPLGARTVAHGSTAAFTVTPSSGYNATVAGTCGGSLTGTTYTTNAITANCTVIAAFTQVNPPRLVNISTRMQVLTGDNVMIGGLVVGGSVNKTVVIRARGPSMVPAGVTNPLVNPKLDLYSGSTVIATSDDWGGNANAAAVTASGFAPPEAAEGAILINLAPGPYTAIVSGVGGTTGVGLMEVFEVDHPEVPLINIATRGRVQTGLDVMIAGFIIQGAGQETVVVRARGPSLAAAGVPNVLANPTLTLVRSSDGVAIASNNDWGSAVNAAALNASGFAPADPLEAAILISLDPGAYTAVVEGVGGTSGVAIVEVFRN